MPFPDSVDVLTDGRVRLRPHTPDDIPRIVDQARDPESLRWTQVPRDYTEADARDFLTSIAEGWDRADGRGPKLWAIEENDDPTGSLCGTIDLRPLGAGRAEVGYGLHPDARRRGIMARAVRLVVRWWFDRGGKRVDWFAQRGNFASWTAARAAGFAPLATLPEHLPDGEGNLVDAWVGTIGRDDTGEPSAPWWHPPVLAGGGVRLRPWNDEDVAATEPHAHVRHHVPAHAIPTPDNFADWLLRRRELMAWGQAMHWCIADVDTDRPLGDVCLFGFADGGGSGELGYFLFPSAQGRGAASAASRLVADWALAPVAEAGMALRRLVANTAADNVASGHILTKAGFVEVGRDPQHQVLDDGSTVDGIRWARLGSPAGEAL